MCDKGYRIFAVLFSLSDLPMHLHFFSLFSEEEARKAGIKTYTEMMKEWCDVDLTEEQQSQCIAKIEDVTDNWDEFSNALMDDHHF